MADELYINCNNNISLEGLIKLAVRDADCGDYLTCANKNESLESLLKRAFSIDDDGDVALNVCGFGGSGGLTSITYEELVALQLAAGFTPGAFYLLTDFATKHYFTDGSTTLTDINTGATEQLILFATAPSVLDSRVYSPSYPQDVIHYDWNPANWLTDISFSSDGVNIVDGWKGVITYRWDTKQDNSTGYDFRNVKFRRWALNPAVWDSETTYNAGDYVRDIGGTGVYRSLAGTNLNNDPVVTDLWVSLVDLTSTTYWSWNSTSMNGITCDEEDYEDFLTWQDYSETACLGNHIGINFILGGPRLSEIVFHNSGGNCMFNKIEGGCFWMTFGNNAFNNSFNHGCNSNTIGAGMTSNTIGASMASNTIGAYMQSNTIGASMISNTIGAGMTSNTIGAYMQSNTIGASMISNTIGANMQSNTIGAGMIGNTIGAGMISNTIGVVMTQCNFLDGITSTDFTAETLMSAVYNKTIQICSDASIVISYIDCTGAPTYTVRAITAP